MPFFKQNQNANISVVLTNSSGDAVTGLTASDVTCYISKDGSSSSAYSLSSRITEVDSTNLPGIYNVLLDSSEVLDTQGEFVARFFDDGSSSKSFDDYLFRGFVYSDDLTGLDSDVASVQSQVDSNATSLSSLQTDVSNVETQVNNNANEIQTIQGGSFSGSTDSLSAIQDLLDQRVPSGVALKKHLVRGTGTSEAPADTGIWDVLGDGTTTLPGLSQSIDRVLGLSQENYRITDQSYDANDNMISAVIKTYPSATDLQQDTNVMAKYVISASYDSQNRLVSYEVEKQ